MIEKLEKIFNLLQKNSVFFISDPSDIFYLTKFTGTFAKILITNKKAYFITDKRYEGEIKNLNDNFEIIITKNFKKDLNFLIKNYKKIFLSKKTLLSEYLLLKNKKIFFNEILNELRMIKSKEEIEKIKKAIEIAEKGFLHILKYIKENITEKDIALEFEYFIKKNEADGLSFDSIIAFGSNSAVPHHRTDDTKLKKNTLILIDAGVKYKAYCSDLTRVVGFGIMGSYFAEVKKYYEILRNARNFSLKFYKNGEFAQKPDRKARIFLKKYNLDNVFLHSLGHGIGIDIHEPPFINSREKIKFNNGMVLTCEPGIYFDQKFGLRLEDDYLINNEKPEKLSKLDENLIIL